jgi:peptide/nickel transport system permease protein
MTAIAGRPERAFGDHRIIRFVTSAGAGFQVGVLIFAAMLLLGIIGPYFLADPNEPWVGPAYAPPGAEHLFGTDRFGRDIFARAVAAIRLDFAIGVGVSVAAMLAGGLLGVGAGFVGRWFDEVVMRVVDVLLSFPGFILALMLTSFMGRGVLFMSIGVTIAMMPHFVRLTRSKALTERGRDYVAAARLSGNWSSRIAIEHVLPNSIGPAIVQSTITAGWVILDIAALSFLGLGVQPPQAEWGTMIAEGYSDVLSGEWWTSVFPGAMIFVSVLSFQLIGDGLERGIRR